MMGPWRWRPESLHMETKTRIALILTDSSQCPPTGIQILTSIATVMKWLISKIDFVSAFLQTGDAKRNVYVIPPRECRRRSYYWLLLTSAYGLVNANAKWQEHCDHLFISLGLTQSRYVPQLFYNNLNGSLDLVAVRIVDDVLIAGENSVVHPCINNIAKVQAGNSRQRSCFILVLWSTYYPRNRYVCCNTWRWKAGCYKLLPNWSKSSWTTWWKSEWSWASII